MTIRHWVGVRINLGKNKSTDPEIVEALECARRMDDDRDEIERDRRQQSMRIAEQDTVNP